MKTFTGVLSYLCGFVLLAVLFSLLGDILWLGLKNLDWAYLTEAPRAAGRKGGVLPVVVSTLWITGISVLFVFPVGLATAIYLSDFYSQKESIFKRSVRKWVEVLSGVPSIVFGLFGNALFCVALGMGFSILSGGLTLACMALPLFVHSVEHGIREVPRKYLKSSRALGLSDLTCLWKVILPLSAPSILTGLVLSLGRALAETAALIFTSGYVDRMPESVFDSGRALSVHIYDLAMNVPGGDTNAYKSAFLLISLILLVNIVFSLLLGVWTRQARS